MSDFERLEGMSAIVTGASAGIGLQIARTLGQHGVKLALVARRAEPLERVACELRADGVAVSVIAGDVASLADVAVVVERAIDCYGQIDVLVNNAGIGQYRSFHETDLEQLLRVVDVNVKGTIALTHRVLPFMLKQGRGCIVNMASTAGKFGPGYAAVYGATKAAMIGLTQSLRSEYYGTGVTATAICPGFTDDGGIYERMKRAAGRKTPRLLGSTDTKIVAAMTLRAIKRDLPEVIVNTPPARPVLALAAAFPRLGERLIRRATRRFFRRAAEAAQEGDIANRRAA